MAGCYSESDLLRYSTGQMSDVEVNDVRQHLADCIWCKTTLDWQLDQQQVEFDSDGEARKTRTLANDQRELPTSSYHAVESQTLADSTPAPPPLKTLKDYEIVRILGSGGYGIVYEAVDKVLDRRVAIKVLKRDFANQATSRRRFIREARAGAAINHPNVVTIHGVDEAGEMPFLIMELITGESLRERVHREPKLELMDILRISAQIAQGLAAAHAQGIIHRDVKPGNVMLVDSLARVKITDFGLARVRVESADLTSRGVAVGTPAYMSPEQVRGDELDTRSDLFALGCVIYALVAGHSPFHGRTALDIARRIDSYDPPPLCVTHPVIPEFLSEVVQRLLKKDREQRYQSAAEVADVLNRHLAMLNATPTDRLPAGMHKQLPSARQPHKQRQLLLAAGAALLGVVSLAVGGAMYGLRERPTALLAARSTVTTNLPANGAAATTPVVVRQAAVTVAQSQPADCVTIEAALGKVAPGGSVTILDGGEYSEALRLDDAERFAGVRLSAPHGAMLRSPSGGPVILVKNVPDFQVSGVRIEASQAQFAVEIAGACPGLTFTDIAVSRIANPEGARGRVAAVHLRSSASGTPERPIVLSGIAVRDTVVGVVIGNADRGEKPPGHIRLQSCFVEGSGRDEATLLVLKYAVHDVVIARNTFSRGIQGMSILADEGAAPQNCEIADNTWHDLENWIALNGQTPSTISLSVHHNLLVDCKQVSPRIRGLASLLASGFAENLVFNPHESNGEDFQPFARVVTDLRLASWDPKREDFLKPEDAAQNLTPAGRHRPENGP